MGKTRHRYGLPVNLSQRYLEMVHLKIPELPSGKDRKEEEEAFF
jgi:hypothetical protein